MNNTLSNFNLEIEKGIEQENTLYDLYRLISTYNTYNKLLLKARYDLEKSNRVIKENFHSWDCYGKPIAELFSGFTQNELLYLTEAEHNVLKDAKDMIFLINDHTLLKIHSYHPIWNNNLYDIDISYKFIRFLDCNVKRFVDKIYDSDPYYCTEHYEYKDAIGLFIGRDLIKPAYNFEKQFESYDGADIRDILIPKSIDEIHEKIKSVKDAKIKTLSL